MSYNYYDFQEATIDSVHRAFKLREISSLQLLEMYLFRIRNYDRNGPKINSIITINPKAIEEAKNLDSIFIRTGKFVGPLHGIPILVKDQIQTKDMPTSFGSIAFKSYQPKDDAFVIKKLRKAGAIILGKTNLPDFGTSWFSFSSILGETRNPYALDRDPGGSSSGTGAAIAANFATVGLGKDTGGSIRVPASFNNLFGVRVTTGLISRSGSSPLIHFHDTTGPMTRSIRDAATLLDVLVGYDSKDSTTGLSLYASKAGNYRNRLIEDDLKGTRIGVLREVFGSDNNPDSSQVNKAVNNGISALKDLGAEIVDPVIIPNLSHYIETSSMRFVQKENINNFLASIPNSPVSSVEELYDNKQYHEFLDLFELIATSGSMEPHMDKNYYMKLYSKEQFRREILNTMAANSIDVILFPNVQVLPPTKKELYSKGKWGVLNFPVNTAIASNTGLPSISMPAGLTEEGIPVGIEIIGKLFDEAELLQLANSYEHFTDPRRHPEIFKNI